MASREELELFIEQNQLDADSSRVLRTCSAEVVRLVIDRGDLRGARNPSSAVMMRIRDAKAGVAAASRPNGLLGGDDPGLRTELERFILENGVDESAANSLRACNSAVQRCVLGRGDLGGARNPSSALLTRIKDAKLMGLDPKFDGDPAAVASMVAANAAGTQIFGGGITYVKMRGLPFSASKEDIVAFFAAYQVVADNITMGFNAEGRASGEAFVKFPTEALAREAVRDRNRQRMEHRYIELFVMTASEVQRAKLPDADLVTTSSVPPPGLQHLQPGYGAANALAAASNFGFLPMAAGCTGCCGGCCGGCGACGCGACGPCGCGACGSCGACAGGCGACGCGFGNDYIHQLAAYYGSYEAAAQALGAASGMASSGIPGLPGLAGLGGAGAGMTSAAGLGGSAAGLCGSFGLDGSACDASSLGATGLADAGVAGCAYGAAPTEGQGFQARASPY